eukprot:405442_1
MTEQTNSNNNKIATEFKYEHQSDDINNQFTIEINSIVHQYNAFVNPITIGNHQYITMLMCDDANGVTIPITFFQLMVKAFENTNHTYIRIELKWNSRWYRALDLVSQKLTKCITQHNSINVQTYNGSNEYTWDESFFIVFFKTNINNIPKQYNIIQSQESISNTAVLKLIIVRFIDAFGSWCFPEDITSFIFDLLFDAENIDEYDCFLC